MRREIYVASLMLSLLIYHSGYSQKKVIDIDACKNWMSLQNIERNVNSLISNDGKYIVYKYNIPSKGDFLVARSIDGTYEKKLGLTYPNVALTEDRNLIYISVGDSLCILKMGKHKTIFIKNVRSFKTSKGFNKKWLAYLLKSPEKELVLKNLFNGSNKRYTEVEDYMFDNHGDVLVVKTKLELIWVDLKSNIERKLFKGSSISQLTFDEGCNQLAFMTKHNVDNEIWYYKAGEDNAQLLISRQSEGLPADQIPNEATLRFTPDGSKLLFELKKNGPDESFISGERINKSLEIYNYKDSFIHFFSDRNSSNTSLAVTSVNHPVVIPVTTPETRFLGYYGNCDRNSYVLTEENSSQDEYYWSKKPQSLYLNSLIDGSRNEITRFEKNRQKLASLSPREKFVIWFDHQDKQYHSYEVKTKISRNISRGIRFSLFDEESDVVARREPFGMAGWYYNDEALLIYDKYDIWKIDPTGRKKPENMTGGYGRTHYIVLRLMKNEEHKSKIDGYNAQILTGFDTSTKENGFWKLLFGGSGRLEKLSMNSYSYSFPYHTTNILDNLDDNIPQKAMNANVYVVTRMSATESPNLFVSTDLKTFKALTNIYPEKDYNWLSTELIKWKLPGGKVAEGMLYKPENLDETIKYPIIFYCYEKFSDRLNQYIEPSLSDGRLSISWYVSNGYLVFVPNIYYEVGHVTKSVVNSINSAVEYLSVIPWIDTKKMGLQGHSFGGFEAISLIAFTNLFAAAQESAGYANSTSYYNHPMGYDANRNSYFDINQGNLGCPPWKCPDVYIDNSPIFHIENVNTPLLMMHNKGDNNVPFGQAIDLFTSLRRLEKKAWLLNYLDGGHTIGGHSSLDFTIRQQQFFDHYLKDKPMPEWMANPSNVGLKFDKI